SIALPHGPNFASCWIVPSETASARRRTFSSATSPTPPTSKPWLRLQRLGYCDLVAQRQAVLSIDGLPPVSDPPLAAFGIGVTHFDVAAFFQPVRDGPDVLAVAKPVDKPTVDAAGLRLGAVCGLRKRKGLWAAH